MVIWPPKQPSHSVPDTPNRKSVEFVVVVHVHLNGTALQAAVPSKISIDLGSWPPVAVEAEIEERIAATHTARQSSKSTGIVSSCIRACPMYGSGFFKFTSGKIYTTKKLVNCVHSTLTMNIELRNVEW